MREIQYDRYFWQNERVRLRALALEDWELHYLNRFDTPARRLLNCEVELPPTEAEARNFTELFAGFKPGADRLMFAIDTLDGTPVGGANLNSIDERNGTFSIGIQIDRDHRGQGYGTAAMEILLEYAFLERRLNKYYGYVLEGNTASATMLRKLGCLQEGIRREMVYTAGRFHDEIHFGLTKGDYLARKRRGELEADLTFRQATAQDAPLVSEILLEAARWLQDQRQPMWKPEDLSVEQVLPDVSLGFFHIAEVRGEPAGVLRFTESDPSFWPELPEGGSAFIHRVAVRRAFGGAGVAAAMIRFAKGKAKELGKTHLRLDCAADRPRLRAVYERQGFRHHSDFQAGPWLVSRYELDVRRETDS